MFLFGVFEWGVRRELTQRLFAALHGTLGFLLELGTDSYTEVVPAPQGGPALVTREVCGERWRPAKAPARPADRH
jgi:hypothetical protein